MAQRVFKYPLNIADVALVRMPVGASILSVANQNGCICLWAMVDVPNAATEHRSIEIIGTGNPITELVGYERRFIGTVVTTPFVWHVFELVADSK